MDAILCPACGASNPVEAAVCESCNYDLQAVKSVVDTANTYYNESLALAHSGRLDEAIGQLEAAIALSGQNPNYHTLLGTVYAQKGLYSEAIQAWERCIALDPDVEKAYRNIDKARRMEEEAAVEERKRPFLLASIAAGVVAVFFLMTTAYLGVRVYFKSRAIDSLTQQLNTKQSEVVEWMGRYKTLNEKLPPEGINQLITNWSGAQKLAEELKKQNDQLQVRLTQTTESHTRDTQALRDQLRNAGMENTTLKSQLEKINSLQASVNQKDFMIQSLRKQITDLQASLKDAYDKGNELKDKLKVAYDGMESLKKTRDTSIEKMRQTNVDAVELLRTQIRELQDEIAAKERQAGDAKYADGLAVEAVKNLERNEFDLASQNVQNMLTRVKDHPVAAYLQKELDRILNDPLEQEVRRQATTDRERQRVQRKQELVDKNLKLAQDSFNKGNYDQAIELSKRILALSPGDAQSVEAGKRLLNQAEDRNKEISVMLLEARRNIADQKKKEAQKILNQILKKSPSNPEAQELLKQIVE